MKYKNCRKCGHANPMENRYCSECGTAFRNMVPKKIIKKHENCSEEVKFDSPRQKIIIYILIGCIVVLGIILFNLINMIIDQEKRYESSNTSLQTEEHNTTEVRDSTEDRNKENSISEPLVSEPIIVETAATSEDFATLSVPKQGMIAAGNYHSAYLYPDGTVFAVGSNKPSEYDNKGTRLDVSEWTDIVAISAASHTVGLKSDGTVVACGVNRYGQCDLAAWTDIVAISAGDDHTVGLRSDGTVVAKGNNEDGQCDVSHWRNIIAVAACKDTTFGLKSDGTIISAGQKNYGFTWRNIASICCGTYDLVGLRNDGTVVATGSSDSWDKNTLANWHNIVGISASSTHIVGLKADGTVVACGRERASEACEVNSWRDIVQVSAGMYFTIGLKSDGTVVSVGENSYNQRGL